MRLTMEPTSDQTMHSSECRNHTVIIETEGDDQSLDDMFDLVKYMLLAWGYHPDNVSDVLEEG